MGIINELWFYERIKTIGRPFGSLFSKKTCAQLGVYYKTLRKYRMNGYIQPINPITSRRLKYSGQSILDCWLKLRML